MSLTQDFNSSHHPNMTNSQVLTLSYGYQTYHYDFQQRLLTTLYTYGSGLGGVTTTPFSQLDREVLVEMRDKLVELGGKPKELPPEAPTLNKPARGLNP